MIVEILARLWAVNDDLPKTADLIIPVSHGATERRVTLGTSAVIKEVEELVNYYNSNCVYPKIRFGAFRKSSEEGVAIEEKIKKDKFGEENFIGAVVSTIEECAAILGSLEQWRPKSIIVVTDQTHSRRCRIVWQTFFPDAQISVISVSIDRFIDWDSPMLAYYSKWLALLFHTLPTPWFKYMSMRGIDYMLMNMSRHQPVLH